MTREILFDEVFEGEQTPLTVSGEQHLEVCKECGSYNGVHWKACSKHLSLWNEENRKKIEEEDPNFKL